MKKLLATPLPPADPDGILTDPQTCVYLGGIQPRTLRLWRHTRGLPHIKITSKVILYRRGDLDGWLNQHRVAMVGAS